jgi:hypothetical protein
MGMIGSAILGRNNENLKDMPGIASQSKPYNIT